MAKEHGESVAFSCMYALNLETLSGLLMKLGKEEIEVLEEFKILLRSGDYGDAQAKKRTLEQYFQKTKQCVCGKTVLLKASALAKDLLEKSEWIKGHVRKKEWLKVGFFNGYYDNKKRRVEGRCNGVLRMILTSQVFPIMSGTATSEQVKETIKSVNTHLVDKKLNGYRLNTDFKSAQPDFGRAFSFVYGDKENGAFFNHMIVMYAYALYKQGYVKEGWQVFSSIYAMAIDSGKSGIYPGLPEYFNAQGRGMYSYLTGSASWFVLTLLTQVFGVKGKDGNLLIEPKLCSTQFTHSRTIAVCRWFQARRFKIVFSLAKSASSGALHLLRVSLDNRRIEIDSNTRLMIERKAIAQLSPRQEHTIQITLG